MRRTPLATFLLPRLLPALPVLLSTALLGSALSALPAAAGPVEQVVTTQEVYERPASGVFEVEGRGWGHGRGMSQWGAHGAASLGRTADEITAAYYPGTRREVLPDTPMRVWLAADEGRDTVVWPADGLRATDAATGITDVLPAGPSRWRVTAAADGLQLSSLTDGVWTPFALGGRRSFAGPVRFSGPSLTRVGFPGGSSRDYRGSVAAVRTGTTSVKTVVTLGLEDYLLGVVPREASSGWRPAALQAQAIAARSYSAHKRARVPSSALYDICDTTSCQVFGGTRLYTASGAVSHLEPASTSEAVRATAGVVRTYDGKPVFAEFSSSNGGWSTNGDAPYLRAREDPWDGQLAHGGHRWSATLPVSALERRYPSIGRLQRLHVTGRDGNGEWGGRVRRVVLEGTSGSVTTTGANVHAATAWPGRSTGLRSMWFRIQATTGSAVVAQSPAPVLVRPPGVSTGTLTATLRNTGTTSWPASGLDLTAAGPAGQSGPLAGEGAPPGRYTGTGDVAPGATATFALTLDAAHLSAGTHALSYRVRLGGGPALGAAVTWQVRVDDARFTAARAPGPAATSLVPSAFPTVLADGRTVVVDRRASTLLRLRARNTGNLLWPGDGSVQLGTSGPRNRLSTAAGAGWVSETRPARSLGAVPPGGTASFDLVLHGGGRPVGVVVEPFEPLWRGRHWLDGARTSLAVVRVDPSVPRLATLHSARTALTLAPNGSDVLVVRLRNLGGSAWTVGADLLAASAPEPLRTSAWPSPTRPPALAANANRPGEKLVLPGEIGEWRVPLSAKGRAAGTYRMVLQPITASGPYGPRVTTTTTVG